MEKNRVLHSVLEIKQKKKSVVNRFMALIGHLFWLHVMIRKKSHRTRITKANRVLNRLKQSNFKAQPGRVFAYIRQLDPFVFEELLLMAFKSRGLRVIHNTRYTGDGGIDGIVVLPNRQRFAVQAKRYQNHINAKHIHDFASDLKRHGCSGGFFIHSGKSGAGVYQQLSSNIILISGGNLHKLLTR